MTQKQKRETTPFIYQNTVWQIMDFAGGVLTKLMKKLMDQLFFSLTRYSRILALRVDFRAYDEAPTNQLISDFFKRIIPAFERKYRSSVAYVWVREVGQESKHPHYHAAFLFNGHRVNHPSQIIKTIMTDINDRHPCLGCFIPKHCYYHIHREDPVSQQAFIYRISYLAKNETKDKKPIQTKNYHMSRNKPHEPNKRVRKVCLSFSENDTAGTNDEQSI